ncbi:hypothetical protein [Rhizobium sp. P007]|uniref:hypothetical protein n=1 Tax=Rhizobium sp. P007 TaxID=285908 RepID=UPI00115A9B48|nr:hypothetical protein [Rhizobium sp. P007]CAD7057902.1 hypothetical protein RP007_05772 [Rhizobium sp. P007]
MTFYTIKAIPTVYRGVRFRSRLEARWAAFFDLAKIIWDYEPFDLEGWTPDFLVRSQRPDILIEVKPVNFHDELNDEALAEFLKVTPHVGAYNVCALGIAPLNDASIAVPFEDCPTVPVKNSDGLWKMAGTQVQWRPNDEEPQDFYAQMLSIFRKKAA